MPKRNYKVRELYRKKVVSEQTQPFGYSHFYGNLKLNISTTRYFTHTIVPASLESTTSFYNPIILKKNPT